MNILVSYENGYENCVIHVSCMYDFSIKSPWYLPLYEIVVSWVHEKYMNYEYYMKYVWNYMLWNCNENILWWFHYDIPMEITAVMK